LRIVNGEIMKHTFELQVRIIKIVLLTLAVLSLIALILADNPKIWIAGLVFGGLIGILNFIQLAKTLERAVTMPLGKAQGYATANYFVRYAIMGVVLFVSLKADYIHTLGTLAGLVSIKFIILVTNLFNDKAYYKRIFARKEEK